MFRIGLLATTALIAASLSAVAAPASASEESRMRDSVISRDANGEFLCTYGGFKVEAESGGSSYSFGSSYMRVAVPIIGHGQTISRIGVVDSPIKYASSHDFTVGIYSNTPSGFPGNEIAGGNTEAFRPCHRIILPIPPTVLKRKTTYWIEEIAYRVGGNCPHGCRNAVDWKTDPNAKHKAYVQYHYYATSSHSSSYTSPWTLQTAGPYVWVK